MNERGDAAARRGLRIDYRVGGVEVVAGETFDLVASLEVVEHVADARAFTAAWAAMSKPGTQHGAGNEQ